MQANAKAVTGTWVRFAVFFAVISKMVSATLLPLPADGRDSEGELVAMGAWEILEPRLRRGSPLVGVLHSSPGGFGGISALLSLLHARSDSAVLLLERRFAKWGSNPDDRLRRNMSQVILWLRRKGEFRELLERATEDVRWSPKATHLVVLDSPTDKNGWTVEEIFRETWHHWIADISVLIPHRRWHNGSRVLRLEVFTHYPYSGGSACGSNPGEVKRVAVWQDNLFVEGSALDAFPQKFLNLQGCTLRITTINFPPISILKVGNDYDVVDHVVDHVVDDVEGLHGIILKEASQRMNFSTKIVVFHPSRYQSSNNPYKKIFDSLLEDQTDMVLGEFVLTPERYEICGQGFLHHWACLTFAVPVFASERYRLLTVSRLATPDAWAALLSCLVISCASAWAVSRLRPNPREFAIETRSAVSDALAAFAGVSLRRPPVAHASRALFPTVCMGGLVATTAIRAHLVSLLSSPDSPPWAPSDLAELAHSGMRVGGPISYTFLAKDLTTEAMKAVLSRYEKLDEEDEVTRFNELAIVGMELNLRYRMTNWTGVRLLKECPLPLPTIVLLQKGSPFRSGLNELGKGLTSGGFIVKWRKNLTRKTVCGWEDCVNAETRKKITMKDLMGTFALHGLGMLVSLVVLAVEIIYVAISERKVFLTSRRVLFRS